MFRGITAVKMDDKGRIAIPARYRDRLKSEADGELVITIDPQDPCLLIYPMPEWIALEQRVQALPAFQPATRRFQRLLLGHASEVTLGNNGRILIPKLLCEHAHLSDAGILLGQGTKFELWSEQLWQQQRDHWLNQQPHATGESPELAVLAL